MSTHNFFQRRPILFLDHYQTLYEKLHIRWLVCICLLLALVCVWSFYRRIGLRGPIFTKINDTHIQTKIIIPLCSIHPTQPIHQIHNHVNTFIYIHDTPYIYRSEPWYMLVLNQEERQWLLHGILVFWGVQGQIVLIIKCVPAQPLHIINNVGSTKNHDYSCVWGLTVILNPNSTATVLKDTLVNCSPPPNIHLVYAWIECI